MSYIRALLATSAIAAIPLLSTVPANAALTFQRQISVDGTTIPCAGERDNCSRTGEATIVVPAQYKLKNWRAEVRDDRNSNWYAEANDLGWAAWDDKSVIPQADGSVVIHVKLRNWSHDRVRFVRVIADVE